MIALAERLRTESRYTPSVIRTTPRPPEEPAAEQTEATQEEATQDETPEDATPERLVPDRKMRTAPTDADRAQPIRLSGLRVDTRVVVAVAAILAVAATLVVVAAALAFWARQATPRLDPRRVLVAGFENRSGEDSLNLVGDIAADWLAQGLLHTGLVNVVDSRTALLAGQSVAVEAMPLRGVARVRALAEQTGAGTVVWGSFYRQGDTLQFDVEVTAANSGQLLRAIDPVRAPLAGRTQAIELMR